jgi:hypothetical protein
MLLLEGGGSRRGWRRRRRAVVSTSKYSTSTGTVARSKREMRSGTTCGRRGGRPGQDSGPDVFSSLLFFFFFFFSQD